MNGNAVVKPLQLASSMRQRIENQTLARTQRCLDLLSQHGRWTTNVASPDGTAWQLPPEDATSSCRLGHSIAAPSSSRWILVVGDSVGRMLYSAFLALVNHTEMPAFGWPTHRVPADSVCVAHVPAGSSTPEAYGWYDPQCRVRWKGGCWDDSRAQTPRGSCTLDYTVVHSASSRSRLTFVWHSLNRKDHLRMLSHRLSMLLEDNARRTPDLLLVSTGLWDIMYPGPSECCCDRIQMALETINNALHESIALASSHGAASLRSRSVQMLLGVQPCPSCPNVHTRGRLRENRTCAHFGGFNYPIVSNTSKCGRDVAKAAGFAYLDHSRLLELVPPLLSSPCGMHHPFGVLAEAIAATALAALDDARLNTPHEMTTEAPPPAAWPEVVWQGNWSRYTRVLRCVGSEPCPAAAMATKAYNASHRKFGR